MSYWFLAINGKSEGPFTADEVGGRIRSGQVTPQTLAYTRECLTGHHWDNYNSFVLCLETI